MVIVCATRMCAGSLPISLSTSFSRLHVCARADVHDSMCGSQVTTSHEFIFSLLPGFRESKSSSCFRSDRFYLLNHTTSPPSYLFWDMVSQWSCNSPKQQAAASAKNPLVWVTPVLGITGAHHHIQVCKGHWGTELSSSYLHSKDWTIWVISPPGCFYTWLFVPGCRGEKYEMEFQQFPPALWSSCGMTQKQSNCSRGAQS